MSWNKIKYKQAANTFIKNGFNATQTIRTIEPKQKPHSARVTGTRMLASVAFQNAVAEQLDKAGMTDEYLDSHLKSIISQKEKLSPKLNAIIHANTLKRRLPKDTAEHKHLHLKLDTSKQVYEEIEKINAKLSALGGAS